MDETIARDEGDRPSGEGDAAPLLDEARFPASRPSPQRPAPFPRRRRAPAEGGSGREPWVAESLVALGLVGVLVVLVVAA